MHPRFTDGLVCHVLLVETAEGLVLVDSGFGLRDVADPAKRIGPARFYTRPKFDAAEAAINQVKQLGFDPHDVRDIVLTHFDSDHIGGLADFPWARVHLTGAEEDAAYHPQGFMEKERYVVAQRDHDPTLVRHTPGHGDSWRGFQAAKEIISGVVLVSLPGHSRGHAAIAVDAGNRWVLQVGDAFYHRGQIDGSRKAPRALLAMERVVAFDWSKVKANHDRLSELWSAAEPDLMLVNAHDPTLLSQAQNAAD